MKEKGKGWRNEPIRHGLASKGVKTVISRRTHNNPLFDKNYLKSIFETLDYMKYKEAIIHNTDNYTVLTLEFKMRGSTYDIDSSISFDVDNNEFYGKVRLPDLYEKEKYYYDIAEEFDCDIIESKTKLDYDINIKNMKEGMFIFFQESEGDYIIVPHIIFRQKRENVNGVISFLEKLNNSMEELQNKGVYGHLW